jgi:hypothetical protein
MESNQSSGHTVYTWSGRAYRLPINEAQFQSLLHYVEEMIAMRGCDNTLDHAQTWARANDVGWARLGRSLRSLGGFCDCEIGLNVAQESADDEEEP